MTSFNYVFKGEPMGSLDQPQMGSRHRTGQGGWEGGFQSVIRKSMERERGGILRWGGTEHGSKARTSALNTLNLVRALLPSPGLSFHPASGEKKA